MKKYIQTVFLALAFLSGWFVPSASAQVAAPVFQFAIFYNINLEIDPGAAMTIAGPVFCNQNIWAGSSVVTFASTVEAVGTVNTTTTDPFSDPSGRYSGTGSPTFTLAGQPVTGANTLILPTGTNADPKTILKLPPPDYALGTPAAYSTNGQVYLANAADLYISNSISGTNSAAPTGTNTFVYYQDSTMTPSLKLMTPDFYILKRAAGTGIYTNYVTTNRLATVDCVTNVQFAGYSFITNALFYDWREGWSTTAAKGKAVQAVQIDIAKFNAWLTNTVATNSGATFNAICVLHKAHLIDSMYVYTGVPLTTTTLPAVRVVNGIQLPSPGGSRSGFTLATQFPLYVLGDFNAKDTTGSALGLSGTTTATIHTYPAAIMADSITILSDNWNDSITTRLPTPSSTTVNAAMLTGIVPTNPNISDNYSGGMENFLRLLENWGGTLTYNGSMVAMFPSQYATNTWRQTGNYYSAPTRHWSFDFNFAKGISFMPPLTPVITSYTNPPAIATQPQSQTVASGNNVTFNIVVSSLTFALGYQWSYNETNILGATNSSLTLTNVQSDQTGNYAVQITNFFGSTLSSNAVLTVVDLPPTISTQPTNQTILVNGNATFNVTAIGSLPLSYQWSFNATNIDGATNVSFALTNVQISQAGNYAVQVTNAFGMTNSSSAALTVIALPPTISTQPKNQTVLVNSNVTFNVTVSGSSPLSYQWSFNVTNIDGATNSLLVLTNVQPAQAGNYAVQVTNPYGSTNSISAALTVITLPPTILTQPISQTVLVNSNVTFNVIPSGSSPFSYQWNFNGTNIDDATNGSLLLTNVQFVQAGNYAVQVTNPYGMTNSSAAMLTVISSSSCDPPPSGLISWWPGEGNANDAAGTNNALANNVGYTGGEVGSAFYLNGSKAYVKIPASDSLNVGAGNGFTFETWINPTNLNPQVVAEWNNGAGGIGVHLWLSGGSSGAGPAGCLYANLYNGVNHIISTGGGLITTGGFQHIALTYDKTSGMAELYLKGVPVQSSNLGTFTPQTSYDLYLGERASGALAGSYFDGAMDESSLYSRALTATEIQTIYLVGSFGKCPPTFPAIIITQPTNQTVTAGNTVTFAVVASGTAPLIYQWQKNGSLLTDSGNVSGSTTTNLVLANVQTNDMGCYSVIVTNLYGSALSSNVVLAVLVPPTITTQPTNVAALAGSTAVFTVAADGMPPFSYQWAFNNTNLDDATNLTLTLSNVTTDQAGVYSVTVTNLAGGVISSNAVLCIYSSAVSTLNGVSLNIDNNIQFTVAGVPGFNYAVQASTNMIDWIPLITNISPFIFIDTNTSGNPQQFYRSLYTP